MKRSHFVSALVILLALMLGTANSARGQNTATLSGVVTDPQGGSVKGAKVTLTNKSTGAERTTVSGEEGRYAFVSLSPGTYKISVDAGSDFNVFAKDDLVVTVGKEAVFGTQLSLRGITTTATVTAETRVIEPTKTEVSNTVDQRQIEYLPSNGRNYFDFTKLNSQTTRDVSPTIGPAPNSGLNIGGARGRSNGVTVDGADAVDNSVRPAPSRTEPVRA